jgi:acetolactate decarboxylase
MLKGITSSHFQAADMAQPACAKKVSSSSIHNKIYQFGVAEAFVNGLYRGNLTLGELKTQGDFGVGSPDLIDGELTVHQGKVYQTKSNGQTKEVSDSDKTPFAFVTFFKANHTFFLSETMSREQVFEQLENHLKNKNGMYAIRISGIFDFVKTRVFPPVDKEPFLPLADIADRQLFFETKHKEGVLIGYKLPPYLNGINMEGFHFHFLADQLEAGGHVLDFSTNRVRVEVAIISDFKVEAPTNRAFRDYKFGPANEPKKY